ncbi:GNAT family N-acetyltransferase [Paenibacillus sp. YYML68]|uniref:GNAT family N-acetyltransferase n=1 Tax=Paenibacillus sp. YYML68 TaxID=2909250 RepID=UPI002490DDEB|nr:GNAT family N-acetyltransferase [Paenibacillus sp. YYML68]
MLTDIRTRVEDDDIRELLEYSLLPDEELLEAAVQQYKGSTELQLLSYEEEGKLIGLVGFTMDSSRTITIKHLVVHPEERGNGYGRGILLELIALHTPRCLEVEVDEDAVDFFRSIGFTVVSIGETVPGYERFQCHYDATDEAAAEEDAT